MCANSTRHTCPQSTFIIHAAPYPVTSQNDMVYAWILTPGLSASYIALYDRQRPCGSICTGYLTYRVFAEFHDRTSRITEAGVHRYPRYIALLGLYLRLLVDNAKARARRIAWAFTVLGYVDVSSSTSPVLSLQPGLTDICETCQYLAMGTHLDRGLLKYQ